MKVIQWVGAVFLLVLLIGYFTSDGEIETTKSVSLEWYQGGTLHESTVNDWNAATHRNKLATAADWTTGVIGQSEFARIGLSGVRTKATELVKCIDGSTNGLSGIGTMSTMEIGAACILLMKQ
jgi:hypothetical protein